MPGDEEYDDEDDDEDDDYDEDDDDKDEGEEEDDDGLLIRIRDGFALVFGSDSYGFVGIRADSRSSSGTMRKYRLENLQGFI